MPANKNKTKELIMKCHLALTVLALAGYAFAEAPYQFRERLVTVHRADRRDVAARPTADEYEFPNGVQIVVPDDASPLVRRAAEDFADYLVVSMGVNASVRGTSAPTRPGLVAGVTISLGPLEKRGYVTTVAADGIRIVASNDRMAAQALFYLEDVMNFRRGPFVRHGEKRRFPVFDERITFAGFGNDVFPDAHLSQIVHAGFTRIEIWLDDYDVISQGPRQDVNDLIERAAKYGLSTLFEPRNRAFVHPDDPKAEAVYRAAYGLLTEYYPKAIYDAIKLVNDLYKLQIPIYITENGTYAIGKETRDPVTGIIDDNDRIKYISGFLQWLQKALDEGYDVRGYYLWSLMDNYEWTAAYSYKFGIYETDFDTFECTPKRSALWYRDFIKKAKGE